MSDTIKDLFSMNLLLACSEDANVLSKARIGCSLHRVFQHFAVIKHLQVHFRDPTSNQMHVINELRLKITDVEQIEAKPNQAMVKKMLYDTVSAFSNSSHLEDPLSLETPWFDRWKQTFLSTFEACEHEFTSACFGCIFVISKNDLKNFRDVLNTLQTHVKSSTNVKWFWPNFLKYYVVLNDTVSDSEKHEEVGGDSSMPEQNQFYNELIAFYGLNHCFWFDLLTNNIKTLKIETQVEPDVFDNVVNSNNLNCEHPLTFLEDSHKLHNNETNGNNVIETVETNHVSEKLLSQVDTLLRSFVSKALIPWTEKQLRVLSESISLRKGLRRSIFSATKSLLSMSSTVNFRGGSNQTVVYSSEANEMQQRKYGDVAMSLTLYEIAYNFYYSAKKEFQSEGAWLYYAGASEACAMASFLINKFQKHYFDQAISCYLETCRSTNLATRSTLLASEALRKIWPNEAASLFIRMTSEDNDLRSALFLEQAAKCFAEAHVSRKRKAAFHYVLAGHRFNRCGLKRHALSCYLRYSTSTWCSAIDHVNFTVAKLYLQISNVLIDENSKCVYRKRGLEILQSHSDKETFFQEFMKEIKKDHEDESSCPNDCYNVQIPFTRSVRREAIEGSLLLNKRQTCYVNECMNFHLTLRNSFSIILDNFKLMCNNADVICEPITVTLEPCDDQTVSLKVTPRTQCDIDFLGVEYKINNVSFVCEFHEKLLNLLKFKAVVALPPIDIGIKISTFIENTDAVELFTGEIVDLIITLQMKNLNEKWTPSKVILTTNGDLLVGEEPNKFIEEQINLTFNEKNVFKLQAPAVAQTYSLYFKIDYYDKETGKNRVLTKTVELFVRECLNVDGLVEDVISLKNVLSNNSITVFGRESESFELMPALTAHLLIGKQFVPWKCSNRKGVINLPKNINFFD
ncbi:trafficking protein particle complex subunit 8-like protein [Dinothrombium tinctorium]|uniref:Trafficking protein particle complex subunit 8-like protein n=1 Tax=Dinothrombium tinctorium TaxID=1965070 RepID=A0A3S3PMN8_9ACAR|nr:trafficking protein particle complex subunit 8-like protein [Dinothrombium tinctorium]RWS12875.1 trafficking protein particle complex subunit 8-like protein [Dinothrombium tinctorium]